MIHLPVDDEMSGVHIRGQREGSIEHGHVVEHEPDFLGDGHLFEQVLDAVLDGSRGILVHVDDAVAVEIAWLGSAGHQGARF